MSNEETQIWAWFVQGKMTIHKAEAEWIKCAPKQRKKGLPNKTKTNCSKLQRVQQWFYGLFSRIKHCRAKSLDVFCSTSLCLHRWQKMTEEEKEKGKTFVFCCVCIHINNTIQHSAVILVCKVIYILRFLQFWVLKPGKVSSKLIESGPEIVKNKSEL